MKLDELVRFLQAYKMTIPARQHDRRVAFHVTAADFEETTNDDELVLIARKFFRSMKRAIVIRKGINHNKGDLSRKII